MAWPSIWEEGALCLAPAVLSLNITVSAGINSQGPHQTHGPFLQTLVFLWKQTAWVTFLKIKHYSDNCATSLGWTLGLPTDANRRNIQAQSWRSTNLVFHDYDSGNMLDLSDHWQNSLKHHFNQFGESLWSVFRSSWTLWTAVSLPPADTKYDNCVVKLKLH